MVSQLRRTWLEL